MRGRAFHPAGLISSYLRAPYQSEENRLLKRCLKHLWTNVLPTLLILVCSSVIALFLGGLIEQSKHEQLHPDLVKPAVVSQQAAVKLP